MAKHTAKVLPKGELVLFVRPKVKHGTVSSNVTRQLVPRKINSVQSKIAIRGIRNISVRGVLLPVNSTEDLLKLKNEMDKTELVHDHSISRPRRRNPEVILFGNDPNQPNDKIVPAVLKQNDSLQGGVSRTTNYVRRETRLQSSLIVRLGFTPTTCEDSKIECGLVSGGLPTKSMPVDML